MWLYAVFCVCIPHIAKRLYSEVMLDQRKNLRDSYITHKF